MSRHVNMKDVNFNNIVIENFKEGSKKDTPIKWKEARILYKYSIKTCVGGVEKNIEEISPLEIKYPQLESAYGIYIFEKTDGSGGRSYSLSVRLDVSNPVHLEIMEFLDKLYVKFRELFFQEEVYKSLMGKDINEELAKGPKITKEEFMQMKFDSLGYEKPLYKHKGDKPAQLIFKIQSNAETDELYLKATGIDDKAIEPTVFINKKLVFEPYQRFTRFFHGSSMKSIQSKLVDMLVIDWDEAVGTCSSSKAAEDYMLNNPEQSKIFAEKRSLLSGGGLVIPKEKSTASTIEKSVNSSKMNQSKLPTKRNKNQPENQFEEAQNNILSDSESENDSDEETSHKKFKPTKKTPPKKTTASSVTAKRRNE